MLVQNAAGESFRCSARARPWSLGVAVEIMVSRHDVPAAVIVMSCALDESRYPVLAALSDVDLGALALAEFAAASPSALDVALQWQESLRALGHDGLSPTYRKFASLPGDR